MSFKERLSRPLATASADDAGALDWPPGAAVSFFCCLAAARVFSRLAFLASALLLAAGAAGMVMSRSRRHAATQHHQQADIKDMFAPGSSGGRPGHLGALFLACMEEGAPEGCRSLSHSQGARPSARIAHLDHARHVDALLILRHVASPHSDLLAVGAIRPSRSGNHLHAFGTHLWPATARCRAPLSPQFETDSSQAVSLL